MKDLYQELLAFADFLEDLLAATSPDYLRSIKLARADYKAGRMTSHREVFGE